MNLLERIIFWAVALGLLALAVVYFFSHTRSPELPTNWDYKDVVTILLAVVTVALTILVIIVAIAAFWSYQKITETAIEKAEKASGAATDSYFTSDAFQTRLELIISERMKNERKNEIEPSLDVSAPDGQGPAVDQPWEDQ